MGRATSDLMQDLGLLLRGIQGVPRRFAGALGQSIAGLSALVPILNKGKLPAAALALFLGADAHFAPPSDEPQWSKEQIARLHQIVDESAADGLPRPDMHELIEAEQRGHPGAISRAATAITLKLARMELMGVAPAASRVEWYIADTDSPAGLTPALKEALATNTLDGFVDGLRPQHPDYAVLRASLAREADPARRQQLARNMERWRWLPHDLGDDFIFANAAGFDVTLWRGGTRFKNWAAISGKKSSPTPSISARAVAVNFNPWWEVPASIAKESGLRGGRTYVWTGTRFRQKPGPWNALGQMKVIMPNHHNIYLHDTPSRGLFGAEERAFSHGCIRVSDALGFAETLLNGSYARQRIDDQMKTRDGEEIKSVVIKLPKPLPVYVTYFTTSVRADGTVAFHKDIYGRDAAISAPMGNRAEKLALR